MNVFVINCQRQIDKTNMTKNTEKNNYDKLFGRNSEEYFYCDFNFFSIM